MSVISNLSANAILAKSRAMYSNMLTTENYNDLANCRTINEAANYLKTHTAYNNAFVAVPNVKISRARLEAVLKKYMLSQIASLCSFEKAIGQELYEIIIRKNDIDCILTCADYLDSQNIGEYMLYIPDFFKEHSEIDTLPLERAASFTDLASALKGTRYFELIKKMLKGPRKPSVQVLENALYDYMYQEATEIIDEKFNGKQREELLSFFKMRSDVKTIESIYRMKKYFKKGAEITSSHYFNSHTTAFTPQEIDALVHAKNSDEVLELVDKSKYGRFLPAGDGVIERKTAVMQLRINEKNLRFSTYPEVVFLHFICILENEMFNLIHIIEGIRYALTPDEILKYLIKSGD